MMICSVIVATGVTNYGGTPELDVDSVWTTHLGASTRCLELRSSESYTPDQCFISCVPANEPLDYFGQFFEDEEDL